MKKTPSWMKTVRDGVTKAFERIGRDSVYAYAGQASFFISISSIPFFMLNLTFLRFFLPVTQEQILKWVDNVLPDSVYAFVETLTDELFSRAGVPLISITAVMLFWASSSGIRALCDGVRNVYGTRLKVPFLKRYALSFFYTIAFFILILISIGLMFFGEYLTGVLTERFSVRDSFLRVLIGMRGVVFLMLLTVFFTGVFKALGRKEIPFFRHMPGAVFSSLGWVVFSAGYSIYANNFANYSYIYGSLAAIILLMLWLYICMTLLLIGAELNAWAAEIFCQKKSEKSL